MFAVGAELSLRASLPERGFAPFVSLGLRALSSERKVRLNGSDALTIPQVQGLLSLGAEWKGL